MLRLVLLTTSSVLAIFVGMQAALAADLVAPPPAAPPPAPAPASPFDVHGWLDFGIEANADSPASGFNGPVVFPDQDGGQFNQGYLYIERTAPSDNKGWFLGGRADIAAGSDAFFMTSAGFDGSSVGNTPKWENSNSTYAFAVPQLYGELDYNDLKIKFGHFYTIIGSESAMANANFFYSHSYAFAYGEPATHTGVLASKPFGNWTLTAGLVEDWNVVSGPGANPSFLGGISYGDKWGSVTLNLSTGNDSTANFAGVGPFANRTLVNFLATLNLTDKLVYTADANYGVQQNTATLFGSTTAHWYGIDNQLVYALNDKWGIGGRFEWFHDADGFNVTGLRPGNPIAGAGFEGDFFEVSAGLNWKPTSHFTIRPEVRYDWFNGVTAGGPLPYNDGASSHQLLFGVDVIAQF